MDPGRSRASTRSTPTSPSGAWRSSTRRSPAASRSSSVSDDRHRQTAQAARLEGRLVALGVTGSIAAYKAPELVRALQAEGAEVVALLTPAAARFVAPLALAALTRHAGRGRRRSSLLPDGRIGHIVVADSADAILVAPATANWLAAMAAGLAGDAVTATCLATSAPVVVAPAMDGEMYAHPATRANVARLRDAFGYTIVEPESGPLASGQSGVGRLAELRTHRRSRGRDRRRPARTLAGSRVAARRPRPSPARRDLAGRHVVITAGGTAEPIDPVRFITNRSTGKMGVAVAEAALDRGAHVTLIAGSVSVPLPERATVINVGSTAQMRAALLVATVTADPDGRASFDALVMAAAVADFRPARPPRRSSPAVRA